MRDFCLRQGRGELFQQLVSMRDNHSTLTTMIHARANRRGDKTFASAGWENVYDAIMARRHAIANCGYALLLVRTELDDSPLDTLFPGTPGTSDTAALGRARSRRSSRKPVRGGLLFPALAPVLLGKLIQVVELDCALGDDDDSDGRHGVRAMGRADKAACDALRAPDFLRERDRRVPVRIVRGLLRRLPPLLQVH